MSEDRKAPTRRTERQARQRYVNRRRRDQQQLAERYEVQPLLPEPEPQGLYRP